MSLGGRRTEFVCKQNSNNDINNNGGPTKHFCYSRTRPTKRGYILKI